MERERWPSDIPSGAGHDIAAIFLDRHCSILVRVGGGEGGGIGDFGAGEGAVVVLVELLEAIGNGGLGMGLNHRGSEHTEEEQRKDGGVEFGHHGWRLGLRRE